MKPQVGPFFFTSMPIGLHNQRPYILCPHLRLVPISSYKLASLSCNCMCLMLYFNCTDNTYENNTSRDVANVSLLLRCFQQLSTLYLAAHRLSWA